MDTHRHLSDVATALKHHDMMVLKELFATGIGFVLMWGVLSITVALMMERHDDDR